MTVWASNPRVPPRSSSAISPQSSSGGCRRYHANAHLPSVTPVATKTVARKPCSARTGSAFSATSRKPSSKLRPIVRVGTSPAARRFATVGTSQTRKPSAARSSICFRKRRGVTASSSRSSEMRWYMTILGALVSSTPCLRTHQAAERVRVAAAFTGYGRVGPTPGIRLSPPAESDVMQPAIPSMRVTVANPVFDRFHRACRG